MSSYGAKLSFDNKVGRKEDHLTRPRLTERKVHMKSTTRTCYWTKLCVLLFLFSYTALAQQLPPPDKAAAGSQLGQDSSSMLEYAKFLREEEKSHREYLEKLYTTTTLVLGLLVTVGIGLVGFFQFRTKKDVREAVDAQFRVTVEQELQNSVEQFKKQLADARQKIEEDVNQLISEVQSRVEGMYVSMSEPVKGEPQLEATPSLNEREREILKLIGESKYSFRSLIGITAEAGEKGLGPGEVNQSIERLMKNGLIGRTLGKKGAERWYVTEAGRRYLMS